MAANQVLDCNALLADLRRASRFAARAGKLRDSAILDRLKAVEQSRDADGCPDPHALTLALNDVTQAIAPMTLADLRSGRDPFEEHNQTLAHGLQLFLAIVALVTMMMIGHSMMALRSEKVGLQALQQLQTMRLHHEATVLRRLAQSGDQLGTSSAAVDLYRQKLGDWISMFGSRMLIDVKMDDAQRTTTWPWDAFYVEFGQGAVERIQKLVVSLAMADDAGPDNKIDDATTNSTEKDVPNDVVVDLEKFCENLRSSERYRAPGWGWKGWPTRESWEDLCFKHDVLQPLTGPVTTVEQDLGRLRFGPEIEHKISLRTEWFLPFLFGCLGAIIFVMRNVANVHTPAMKPFPVLMHISLGGIAGIVIGWFSSAALPAFQSPGALSLPFALSFLIGYGIDTLFSLLDRLSRMAAADPAHKAA